MPTQDRRPERENGICANQGAGKKEGRALARPEFREETPRRRTAEPPEVIHAAPHKIIIAGWKSTPDKNSLAALGISHGSEAWAARVLCGAQTIVSLQRSTGSGSLQ